MGDEPDVNPSDLTVHAISLAEDSMSAAELTEDALSVTVERRERLALTVGDADSTVNVPIQFLVRWQEDDAGVTAEGPVHYVRWSTPGEYNIDCRVYDRRDGVDADPVGTLQVAVRVEGDEPNEYDVPDELTVGTTYRRDHLAAGNRFADEYQTAVEFMREKHRLSEGSLANVDAARRRPLLPDQYGHLEGSALESQVLLWDIVKSLCVTDPEAFAAVGVDQYSFEAGYLMTLEDMGVFGTAVESDSDGPGNLELRRPEALFALLGFADPQERGSMPKLSGNSPYERYDLASVNNIYSITPGMIAEAEANVFRQTLFHDHGQAIVSHRLGVENAAVKLAFLLLHGVKDPDYTLQELAHGDVGTIVERTPGTYSDDEFQEYALDLSGLPYVKQLDTLAHHLDSLSQSATGRAVAFYLYYFRDHPECIDPVNIFSPPDITDVDFDDEDLDWRERPIVCINRNGKDEGMGDLFDNDGTLNPEHRLADAVQESMVRINFELLPGLQMFLEQAWTDEQRRRDTLVELITGHLSNVMPAEEAVTVFDGVEADDYEEWGIDEVTEVGKHFATLFGRMTKAMELQESALQGWENTDFSDTVQMNRELVAGLNAIIEFTTVAVLFTETTWNAFDSPGELDAPDMELVRQELATFVSRLKVAIDLGKAMDQEFSHKWFVDGVTNVNKVISAFGVATNLTATVEHTVEGDPLRAVSSGLQTGLGVVALADEKRLGKWLAGQAGKRAVPILGYALLLGDILAIATDIATEDVDERAELLYTLLESSAYGTNYFDEAEADLDGDFYDITSPTFGFTQSVTNVQADLDEEGEERDDPPLANLNRQISALRSFSRPLGDEAAGALLKEAPPVVDSEYELYVELVQSTDRIQSNGTIYVRPIVHYEENESKPYYVCPALHRVELDEFHEDRPDAQVRTGGTRTNEHWHSQYPFQPAFPFDGGDFPFDAEEVTELTDSHERRWVSGPETAWWPTSRDAQLDTQNEEDPTDADAIVDLVETFDDPLAFHALRLDWTDLLENDPDEDESWMPNHEPWVADAARGYPQNGADEVEEVRTAMEAGVDDVRVYPNGHDRFGVTWGSGAESNVLVDALASLLHDVEADGSPPTRSELRTSIASGRSFPVRKLLVCLRGPRAALIGKHVDDGRPVYLELVYVPAGVDKHLGEDVVYGMDIEDIPDASRCIVEVDQSDKPLSSWVSDTSRWTRIDGRGADRAATWSQQ